MSIMFLYNSYILLIMGNESIDLGLGNIWRSWFVFRKGKQYTRELHGFQYYLEENLLRLFEDLNGGTYKHGKYKKFTVCDNKRREISVASLRDRVVHRLVYDYLNEMYDKTFIYDAWSCRKGKGLLGAIKRIQDFLRRYHKSFIWKCDIRKFFDSVDQNVLMKILRLKVKNPKACCLIEGILNSYSSGKIGKIGISIGNLTSQIFANIYLNELDRFVKHQLKPKAYLRYGDDFILVNLDLYELRLFKEKTIDFLRNKLRLEINPKNDNIIKTRRGLKLLGVVIWPFGRRLNRRNLKRVYANLNFSNIASYYGIFKQHISVEKLNQLNWFTYERLLSWNL